MRGTARRVLILCAAALSAGADPGGRTAAAALAAATASAGGPVNLAASGTAKASSVLDAYAAAKAIDGEVSDEARWVSTRTKGPHWLEVEFPASLAVGSAHLYSGWGDQDPVHKFRFEYWDGSAWQAIPGASATFNTSTVLAVEFEKPVDTTRLRLFMEADNAVRVKELLLWAPVPGGGRGSPELGLGVRRGLEAAPDRNVHHVLVNQVGYNVEWPKRFTAPISPDGSAFEVIEKDTGRAVFRGKVERQIGDFSTFNPVSPGSEYFIRVSGGTQPAGESFPFRVAPMLIQQAALLPALQFMIDSRSVVGTHPSAYGGTPWRDGTYYTFEMPSVVLMYLANPAFFESVPPEIDYAADKRKVLDPTFKLVPAKHDVDSLAAARRYYQELDPPVGDRVPDAVQLMHWGVGMILMDPESFDPSGDPVGNKLHDQTIEQLAFFLYAHPHVKQYFTQSFYDRARDFTFEQWEKVGLLGVITQYADAKGRIAPGHSVLPNLLMHEVAKREGRPDARRYLDAAAAQATWLIETFVPADPRVGKGQRMSEHKIVTGLALLARDYPSAVPAGLAAWLAGWTEAVIARSENLYDFRRYDDQHWTVPKPYNEPGNIAGFPAVLIAAAGRTTDAATKARLYEIAGAHVDNLFGRNPMNAATSADATDYPGIDRPWPLAFPHDVCARLELCRGTINSNAATEHYPFQPHKGGFRHCEGWTAFNAALNVSLAYASYDATSFEMIDGGAKLRLHAPAGADPKERERVRVVVTAVDGKSSEVELEEVSDDDTRFDGTLNVPPSPGPITVSYGVGFLRREASLSPAPDTRK